MLPTTKLYKDIDIRQFLIYIVSHHTPKTRAMTVAVVPMIWKLVVHNGIVEQTIEVNYFGVMIWVSTGT